MVGLIGLNLFIYDRISMSFGVDIQSRLPELKTGYFNYIVLGELTLLLPLCLSQCFAQATRDALSDGTFTELCLLPWRPSSIIFFLGLAPLMRQVVYFLVFLFIAVAFFKFEFNWNILGLQFITIPAFASIGLFSAAFLIRYGRGMGLVNLLVSVAPVLAGAYFPVEVLPLAVRKISLFLSPFTALLELTRGVNSSWDPSNLNSCFISLGIWTFFGFPLACLLASRSLHAAKKRGSFEVIPN